jgi:hypothetical protein
MKTMKNLIFNVFDACFDWKNFHDEKYLVYKQTIQNDKCKNRSGGGVEKKNEI